MAVRTLGIQPSEFWQMKPRHFWWLAGEVKAKTKGPSMSKAEADELLDLLARAERGDF